MVLKNGNSNYHPIEVALMVSLYRAMRFKAQHKNSLGVLLTMVVHNNTLPIHSKWGNRLKTCRHWALLAVCTQIMETKAPTNMVDIEFHRTFRTDRLELDHIKAHHHSIWATRGNNRVSTQCSSSTTPNPRTNNSTQPHLVTPITKLLLQGHKITTIPSKTTILGSRPLSSTKQATSSR